MPEETQSATSHAMVAELSFHQQNHFFVAGPMDCCIATQSTDSWV